MATKSIILQLLWAWLPTNSFHVINKSVARFHIGIPNVNSHSLPFQIETCPPHLFPVGDLNAWRVNDHLGSLGAECIIGREDHVDGEFISMLSRCGNGSLRREMSVYSMWTDATRTYHLLEGHQRRLTITQLRMETWSQEDLNGRAEIAWLRLVASGLKSSLRQLETSFFERVAELDPRALCTSFTSIRTYAEWKYRPNLAEYESPGGISFDTSRSPALNEWVGCNLGRDFVGKPAILHLRPRLGSRPGFHPETAGATRSPRAGALVRCSVSEVGLLT